MQNVFIVDGYRTPIGSFGGALSPLGAVELGKCALAHALKQSKISPEAVDEAVIGCVFQAGLGQNVARQIAVGCAMPKERTAMTVNMVCGSGLRAVSLAAQAVKCGDAEIIAAGGAESMSNAPYLLKKARGGYRMGHGELTDIMIGDGLWDVFNNYHMGVTAENLAEKYGITREMQDKFAAESQNKAEKAVAAGKFRDEIAPVTITPAKGEPVTVAADEYPKSGVTVEKLAKLRPAFKKDGTVTAGNASGVNDGAACLVVAGEAAVKKLGLKPRARIVSYAYAGTDPAIMGIGPVQAVKNAVGKAGWKLEDIDLIEANEAFAVQSLAVASELRLDMSKVNVNGGAIALGHPIGASGARILVTLLHEMGRRKAAKGLATLCIGGGMGIAMCVETA